MLHTKFRGNRSAGSGKGRFLKGFYHMWAWRPSWPSCHQIFISLYLKAFIRDLVQIGKVVSEKIWFEFLYIHDIGPRSRNDLDLQYSHNFIYSIRCLTAPTNFQVTGCNSF